VLSSLLFTRSFVQEFRDGLQMDLLYTYGLVLMAATKEMQVEKIQKWKKSKEEKGLQVNSNIV